MEDDCISRKAVLKVLTSIAKVKAKSDEQKALMGRVMFFIEQLPPVNPQESVLDKIRAEINGIEINGKVDEHTMFLRMGEQVKQIALEIIDKYKAESEET